MRGKFGKNRRARRRLEELLARGDAGTRKQGGGARWLDGETRGKRRRTAIPFR